MRLKQLIRDGRSSLELVGPNRTPLRAELRIDGLETRLRIFTSVREHFEFEDRTDLVGRLPTDTFVTALDALKFGWQTMPARDGTRDGVLSYHPPWLALGHSPFQREAGVTSVSFSTRDAPLIFSNPSAFGSAVLPEDTARGVFAEHGGPRPLRGPAQIAYFAGESEILEADTAVGRVRVQHLVFPHSGNGQGMGLRGRIFVTLAFPEAASLETALHRVHVFRRLLELLAGRAQRLKRLSVLSAAPETKPGLSWFEIYMAGDERERVPDRPRPHVTSLPLTHGLHPAAFPIVLTAWLAQDADRADARSRFRDAFLKCESFSVDRLVAAANMFDVLPASAVPQDVPISAELAAVRDEARDMFRPLPPSPERDSVLRNLGRVGKSSLTSKVLHRAAPLRQRAGDLLPDLDKVLKAAINARNFYVHGALRDGESAAVYEAQMHFLTEALEFTFGCSDLIDAGWNFGEWLRKPRSEDHVFSRFARTYALMLADYRAAVATLVPPAP